MSERHEPACPMMRAATGLQHNLGRLELAEEGFDLAPSELAAQHRAVLLVDTVQREHVLGRVDRNALKLHEDGPSLEHDSPTLARDAVGPSTPTTAPDFDSRIPNWVSMGFPGRSRFGRVREMGQAVAITDRDHSAEALRRIAARHKDAEVVRRLLALALVLEGVSRTEAARRHGMDRQTLCDWVHR